MRKQTHVFVEYRPMPRKKEKKKKRKKGKFKMPTDAQRTTNADSVRRLRLCLGRRRCRRLRLGRCLSCLLLLHSRRIASGTRRHSFTAPAPSYTQTAKSPTLELGTLLASHTVHPADPNTPPTLHGLSEPTRSSIHRILSLPLLFPPATTLRQGAALFRSLVLLVLLKHRSAAVVA